MYWFSWILECIDKPSTTSKNKYGDIGNHCLSPLVGVNKEEANPLISTTNETMETQPILQLTTSSFETNLYQHKP